MAVGRGNDGVGCGGVLAVWRMARRCIGGRFLCYNRAAPGRGCGGAGWAAAGYSKLGLRGL